MQVIFVGLMAAVSPAWAMLDIPVVKSVVPTGSGTDTKIAYGVYVAVGGTGASPRLYQLDSGNGSFLAGYAADPTVQYWGAVQESFVGSNTAGFGSGVSMIYNTVRAQVTLSNASGDSLLEIPSMAVGQVYSATGGGLSTGEWATLIANDQPALHSTYYGNFGVDLYSTSGTTVPANQQLFSALGQIEGVVGFVMSLSGTAPTLRIVYDTDTEYVASFTKISPMKAGNGQTFPNTGYSTTDEHQIVTAFAINEVTSSGTTNGLFDSGGTNIYLPESMKGELETAGLLDGDYVIPGQTLTLTLEGGGQITVTTGTTEGVDLVGFDDKESDLNFGPGLYNDYDVFFNIRDGTVGYSAIPEPGVVGLLLAAGVIGAGVWWRRRLLS